MVTVRETVDPHNKVKIPIVIYNVYTRSDLYNLKLKQGWN